MIPLIKLFMVLSKILAKPFIASVNKVTKNRAGRLRHGFVYLGNRFHHFEVYLNRKFMGLENSYDV